MLTNQRVFDKAWMWYVWDGQPLCYDLQFNAPAGYTARTRYRLLGMRDPIALHIPEELEIPYAVMDEAPNVVLDALGISYEDASFVNEIRAAHDRAARGLCSVQHAFRAVAAEYGLTIPERRKP